MSITRWGIGRGLPRWTAVLGAFAFAAAVMAAEEILAGLADPSTAGDGPIEVGIGAATGPAFVGSIQAANRMIWSALGNTTNLAARLQGLTRDLEVAAVIDEATWDAAGPLRGRFGRRAEVHIRGLREPRDVFVARFS